MDGIATTPSAAELNQMIYSTLQETIGSLTASLDTLKAQAVPDYAMSEVESIIERTRLFVVFAKYCGDYLRRVPQKDSLREELLKIKLHLLSVLRSLGESLQAQDRAAVHDLLTEELRDNLTLWKIKILPLLRPARALASGSPQA